MKVAVIAAHGRSGRMVVAELLRCGHQVRAGVLGNHGFHEREGFDLRMCEATQYDDVSRLMDGCDAVVSMIGHVRGSRPNVQTLTAMNIAKAGRRTGVKRVVSLTGTGVRFPGDHVGFMDRLLNVGISRLDPARVRDGRDHAEVLRSSGLNWTLLRVLKLTDGQPGTFTLSTNGPAKVLVPRAEVAQAVREVLEAGSFMRQAPIICPGSKDS
jgi:putative NADH-flavin reductase